MVGWILGSRTREQKETSETIFGAAVVAAAAAVSASNSTREMMLQ